jgi:AraC family transcriptional regulator of adaptative response/methylated-DNA-[protein]-cysteine methyltransferase
MNTLDDIRWRAVESRDQLQSGFFFYGVSTTGIYCRPGCASRRPLRKNVDFFVSSLDAVNAGYRACQRCRPDRDVTVDPALAAVIALCRRLETSSGSLDVASFAGQLGYSDRHLRRRFNDVVGVSIGTYQRAVQARRVRTTLKNSVGVIDAALDAGYGSSRAFYEHGATRLGMSPGRYRDGGLGEHIRWTSLDTPVGLIVVASTEAGVCFVQLGDDETELIALLVEEFPRATIERDDEGLADVARVLASAVRGEGDPTLLPLDLQGTAFQIRVWEALRKIPSGRTTTYSAVAASIGAPSAVRAVASAVAANPAALVVPCHRVIRRDGSLGGYRWGLATKEALLDSEAAFAPS